MSDPNRVNRTLCLLLSFFLSGQINAIEKLASDRKDLRRALNHARPGNPIIMAAHDWTDLKLKVTRSALPSGHLRRPHRLYK